MHTDMKEQMAISKVAELPVSIEYSL